MIELHEKSLTYSATSLASHLMHAVFSFYYVKIYTQRFHITQAWFQSAQVVFLVWNAINDPLFGYFQDNYDFFFVRSRRHSILYGAPWFALSFLMMWIPWGDYGTPGTAGTAPAWLCGVQLMVGLCFYDAVFSFSLLAHCALFTELSTQHAARIRLIRYSQVASLIGNGSVFLINITSHNSEDYTSFVWTCVGLAVVAALFMTYTGLYSTTQYESSEPLSSTAKPKAGPQRHASEFSIVQQTLQILRQQNFMSFVIVNFMSVYYGSFITNFSGVFCDSMVTSEYVTSLQRSLFYGSLFLVPQIVVFVSTPLVQRFGYFNIFRASFIVRIILGCLLFLVGPSPYFLMTFFLFQRISSGVGTLINLSLSDIIDTDMELHSRSHPISSMVYGTNALITKPASSFAPMFTVYVLSAYGYQQHRDQNESGPLVAPSTTNDLHNAMFVLSWSIPVVIGVMQLLMWSRYTIRDSHQTLIKHLDS